MELDAALIAKVQNYQPPRARLTAFRDVPIIFMVGISGAGKNAVMRQLEAQYPGAYHRFVTHTTRAPRENHGVMEQNGIEYHFIDFDAANHMLDAGEYVEANVYSNNIYGTSVTELVTAQEEGNILMGDIDVNGVSHFHDLLPHSKPIFILPPSYEVWQERFFTRYKEVVDEQDWRNRMVTAKREIEHVLATPYYYMVVNDDLKQTATTIDAIASGELANHMPHHAREVAEQILAQLNQTLEQ